MDDQYYSYKEQWKLAAQKKKLKKEIARARAIREKKKLDSPK